MSRSRWPKTMPRLSESDFFHGAWAVGVDTGAEGGPIYKIETGEAIDELDPRVLEKYECGTRCCLVGHARHAFGLPADPTTGDPNPPQCDKFLRRFLENAGYDPELFDGGPLWSHASRLFEGYDGDELTARKAARVWNKTIRDFGYTGDA